MVLERVQQMTVEEFLDFAESSEEHYEFIDGEPYKMSGGTLNHFRIITDIIGVILNLLAENDCEVISNGMLVKAGERRLVAPDVLVARGEPETESNTRILLNPILVVEVLSPTSIEQDRVVKREYYWDVPSIQAYLIVDPQRPLVELFARGETDWQIQRYDNLGDEAWIEALNCSLPVREIYRRVEFEEDAPTAAEDL